MRFLQMHGSTAGDKTHAGTLPRLGEAFARDHGPFPELSCVWQAYWHSPQLSAGKELWTVAGSQHLSHEACEIQTCPDTEPGRSAL